MAYLETENYPLNVGTVLFSLSDTKKTRWSKKEVALLRTRKYFQRLVPLLKTINTQNEKYVDILLDYFKNAYKSIKREAPNAEADSVMTLALSDVIGGYLKVWALPVTKFSFYGGAVSEDNAVRLFKFYDEIKNYLRTDGEGWKDSDPNVFHYISINTISKREAKTRSMPNPCELLAYYEKTTTGLSVPTPIVNWNDEANTMFIPLKKASLVPLQSPSSTNTLFKYYDIAKKCMQTSSQAEQENFDQRFQSWLTDDVVPHLSDDHLYLALGSVLTLVNTTKSLYDSVVNSYGDNATGNKKLFYIRGLPIDFHSKKVVIITIILFLEVAWCIPALLYITCKRRKRDGCSNVYLFVEPKGEKRKVPRERLKLQQLPGRKSPDRCDVSEAPSLVMMNSNEQMVASNTEQRLCKSVGTKQSSVGKSSMATNVQSFHSSKVCSTEVARVVYDSPIVSLKPSLKKVTSDKIEVIKPEPRLFSQSSSLTTINKLDEVKPLLKQKDRTAKVRNQTSKQDDKNKSNPLKNMSTEVCDGCPCVSCLNEECKIESKKDKRPIKSQKSEKLSKTTVTRSNKETATNSKMTRFQTHKEVKVAKANKGLKLTTGKPYVEITIDRPETEISVGIGAINQSQQNARPSKIPKLSNNVMYASCPSPSTVQNQPMNTKKTHIPQPKKRLAVDDIVIKNKGTSVTEKLNTTL